MARYTGPIWKKSRRLSFSILESGEELRKRNYVPGQHGKTRRIKLSNYGEQLREKQRIRYLYGLNERQFFNLYQRAVKSQEVTGYALLILLESRLDNIAYRMGLARTRNGARQLVNHGHLLVNGKKVNIPSYTLQPGDEIEVREKSKNNTSILDALEAQLTSVAFIEFDKDNKKGKYLRLPERNELNAEINEAMVVEFYSR